MTLGQTTPIGAFCILCHDADAVLPFYRDVLGFEPRRAEESFYHFGRRGSATALCLWEIGHIARHTVYDAHPSDGIPNKFVLSLTMAGQADVDALFRELQAADAQIIGDRAVRDGAYGFFFIDPCAVIWDVRANQDAAQSGDALALDRITLICQDLAAAASFYEAKLGHANPVKSPGFVTYPAMNETALSLWDAVDAGKTLGLDFVGKQRKRWPDNTAMLAHSFETFEEVCALFDGLSEAGVPFDEAPAHFDWDFRACYFRDPDDNIWELFEVPGNIESRMLPKTA